MSFGEKEKKERDSAAFPPLRRWLQTVSGYYPVYVSLLGTVILSFLPALAALNAFFALGGLIFPILAFLLLPLYSPVWISVHRMLWEFQYAHPVYYFKEFFSSVFRSFWEKYLQGMAISLPWVIVLLPLAYAEWSGTVPPIILLAFSLISIVILIPFSAYANYQSARYRLSIPELLKNSAVLVFSLGVRSLAFSGIWMLYIILFLVFPPYLLACSVIFVLPVLITITGHSIYAVQIDSILISLPSEERIR